jgi:chromatin segregation and condensation protein Rec8/ScpA/Scc1 (kleisin family)
MRDEEQHEWDRQPGESSKAFRHLCLYRDAGQGRSLRKLAADAKTTSKLRQLQHWSSRWKWVERCRKYDDHLEYQDRLRHEKEREQMHERHAKIAVLGQNIVVREMESLLAEAQNSGSQMTPSDVARLLDVTVKVERLARGDPTESHEVSGPSGGPVRLSLKETLEEIRKSYGLATEEEADETRRASDGAGTPDPKA